MKLFLLLLCILAIQTRKNSNMKDLVESLKE